MAVHGTGERLQLVRTYHWSPDSCVRFFEKRCALRRAASPASRDHLGTGSQMRRPEIISGRVQVVGTLARGRAWSPAAVSNTRCPSELPVIRGGQDCAAVRLPPRGWLPGSAGQRRCNAQLTYSRSAHRADFWLYHRSVVIVGIACWCSLERRPLRTSSVSTQHHRARRLSKQCADQLRGRVCVEECSQNVLHPSLASLPWLSTA